MNNINSILPFADSAHFLLKGTGLTANLTDDQRIKLALLRESGCGALKILNYRANHPLATLGSSIDDLFHLSQ
tara:strand:- start:669 stop:887 length:219 start_codon:yes stop_codon:yes gene_type:complete